MKRGGLLPLPMLSIIQRQAPTLPTPPCTQADAAAQLKLGKMCLVPEPDSVSAEGNSTYIPADVAAGSYGIGLVQHPEESGRASTPLERPLNCTRSMQGQAAPPAAKHASFRYSPGSSPSCPDESSSAGHGGGQDRACRFDQQLSHGSSRRQSPSWSYDGGGRFNQHSHGSSRQQSPSRSYGRCRRRLFSSCGAPLAVASTGMWPVAALDRDVEMKARPHRSSELGATRSPTTVSSMPAPAPASSRAPACPEPAMACGELIQDSLRGLPSWPDSLAGLPPRLYGPLLTWASSEMAEAMDAAAPDSCQSPLLAAPCPEAPCQPAPPRTCHFTVMLSGRALLRPKSRFWLMHCSSGGVSAAWLQAGGTGGSEQCAVEGRGRSTAGRHPGLTP